MLSPCRAGRVRTQDGVPVGKRFVVAETADGEACELNLLAALLGGTISNCFL